MKKAANESHPGAFSWARVCASYMLASLSHERWKGRVLQGQNRMMCSDFYYFVKDTLKWRWQLTCLFLLWMCGGEDTGHWGRWPPPPESHQHPCIVATIHSKRCILSLLYPENSFHLAGPLKDSWGCPVCADYTQGGLRTVDRKQLHDDSMFVCL